MWEKPWQLKEALTVGAGLAVTGAVLQSAIGPAVWKDLAFPANVILLAVVVVFIIAAHLSREKVYFFKWLGGGWCATGSIIWAAAVTVVMGLTKQVPGERSPLGISDMLSNWSMILAYLWMTVSLGLVTAKSISRFEMSRIPFILNHLGFFIAITCAVAGSADMERYRMTAQTGNAEWRATDADGKMHELPVAVELKDFRIDEFPPKLMVVDNGTGDAAQGAMVMEEGVTSGNVGGWSIEIEKYMPSAAPVFSKDTSTDVRYNEFRSMGAADAAYVKAYKDGATAEGWVSPGSFAFPMKTLMLDSSSSVLMPEREPKRYVSDVIVYTESGKKVRDSILVNRPCRIDGWKIYQTDYDRSMGKWSDKSVFEIRCDPWMPAVYTGIWMMIAGAVCMIILPERRRKRK